MDEKRNPYPGINAHLNSALQQEGWEGFHTKHLTHLADYLDSVLPPEYYAANEDSLQIGHYYPFERDPIIRTKSDINIYHTGQPSARIGESSAADTPTLVLPIAEEDYVTSVVIYKGKKQPVTRIELLSPSNKPPAVFYRDHYLPKRDAVLLAGTCLVEIDYLHQTRPILYRIPSYPDRDERAYPYYIAVTDPRPDYEQGMIKVYGFGILDKLPVIDIPLDGNDTVRVDFGTVYNRTFENTRLFWQIYAEYSEPPVNFDAYTPADQEKITKFLSEML